VIALSFTLEENEVEDWQYPIEDILDKYLAHISEEIHKVENNILQLELCTQNWLDKMIDLKSIVGKRIYTRAYVDETDGKTYCRLIIEKE